MLVPILHWYQRLLLFLRPTNINDLKIFKIGTWNVTTSENNYRTGILTDEFRRFKLDLLGVSETHIPGVDRVKLGDIEFVNSGRKNGVDTQGVGFMMNKEAVKSCFGWGRGGIKNRIPSLILLLKV